MPRRGAFQRVTGYSGGGKDTEITERHRVQTTITEAAPIPTDTPPDCQDFKHLCDSSARAVDSGTTLRQQTVLKFTEGN